MNISLLSVFVVSVFFALALRIWSKIHLGDALTAAIMFIPAFLYWADGKPLEEISGGTDGITLKLRATSTLPISELSLNLDATALRHDPEDATDNQTAAFWGQCGDYITVKSINIPSDRLKRDQYIATLATAIRASMLCGRLIGVIVLDERERYIGSYRAAFFVELAALWAFLGAEQQPSASELVSLMNHYTIFGASLQFPEKRLQSGEGFVAAINHEAPLSAALERFAETNDPFLAVTDEQGVLTGILPRERVVDAILVALAAPNSRETLTND